MFLNEIFDVYFFFIADDDSRTTEIFGHDVDAGLCLVGLVDFDVTIVELSDLRACSQS